MCIAVPGQIKSITGDDPLMRLARIDFSSVMRDINIVLVPEARVGDWVLVHAGVAIGLIDEEEATRTIEAIRDISGFDGDA